MKKPLSDELIEKIYKAREEQKHEPPRDYIGFSSAGDKCQRRIWLTYQGQEGKKLDGRVLYLLDRGKREEEIAINKLKSIGIQFNHILDNQLEVKASEQVKGHLDGVIIGGVKGENDHQKYIFECKTSKLEVFKKLKEKGIKKVHEDHWAQVQCYMYTSGISRTLYMSICKDNDEIYIEIIKLEKEEAKRLIDRLVNISKETRLPPPLSTNPTWYECKNCKYYDYCFKEV